MTDYIRDGHRFTLRVAEGGLIGDIECPGKGKCQAWVEPPGVGQPPRPADACYIVQFVGDLGWQEFAEYQHKTDGEYLTAELPVEIEWVAHGFDEDWELFWRPLAPPVSNMRQGLDALLRYFPNADVVRVLNQNDTLHEVLSASPLPPFEVEVARSPGPWTTVDLVLVGNVLRMAIWNQTGNVYRLGADGAVEDDCFIEVQTR